MPTHLTAVNTRRFLLPLLNVHIKQEYTEFEETISSDFQFNILCISSIRTMVYSYQCGLFVYWVWTVFGHALFVMPFPVVDRCRYSLGTPSLSSPWPKKNRFAVEISMLSVVWVYLMPWIGLLCISGFAATLQYPVVRQCRN